MSSPAELPAALLRRVLRIAKPTGAISRRLFWLPHAGGSSTSFPSWHRFFPADWEVVFLEVPLAHDGYDEPRSLDEVVELYLAAIRSRLDRPYAFFGHSLGALVALELSRKLRELGLPMPSWLGASGRRPPDIRSPAGQPLSTMTDTELIERIRAYGGTPPQILADGEFRTLLLHRLRRDLAWSEEHPYRAGPPLDLPITAFTGDQDASAPPETLVSWRRWTSQRFRERVYAGGHFYLFQHRDAVCAAIRSDLEWASGER